MLRGITVTPLGGVKSPMGAGRTSLVYRDVIPDAYGVFPSSRLQSMILGTLSTNWWRLFCFDPHKEQDGSVGISSVRSLGCSFASTCFRTRSYFMRDKTRRTHRIVREQHGILWADGGRLGFSSDASISTVGRDDETFSRQGWTRVGAITPE